MTAPGQPTPHPAHPGPALGRPVRGSASVPAPSPPPAQMVQQPEAGTDVIAPAAAAAGPPPASPVAAAAPAPPAGPPSTDPEVSDPPESGQQWRARRHRRLHRMRIGQHTAPADALDQLQLRAGSVGLRLGLGHAGEPVALRLFRPRPTRVVLVGDLWAAQLITYRALRFGARVVVFTQEPEGWIDLGRRATGRTDRVAALAPGATVSRSASADAPVLRVVAGVPPPADLPDWTTSLGVVPPVTVRDLATRPDLGAAVAAAEIMLAHRMSPPEVAALASVWRLSAQVQQALPGLPDGVLAMLDHTGVQYAWTGPIDADW